MSGAAAWWREYKHAERNYQGRGNAILAPSEADRVGQAIGRVRCRERLGGLLKFYHRSAG